MKKAFTLIELLVVLVIIGVLFALLAPAIGRARGSARPALCINNLRQLFLAATLFSDDKGYYPRSYLEDEEEDFFPRYLDGDKEVFHCPEVRGYFNDEEAVYSYGWFWFKRGGEVGTVFPVFMEKASSQVPMFADSNSHEAANVYVLDIWTQCRFTLPGPTHPADFDGNGAVDIDDLNIYKSRRDSLEYRHRNWANIIYLDGHVESVIEETE